MSKAKIDDFFENFLNLPSTSNSTDNSDDTIGSDTSVKTSHLLYDKDLESDEKENETHFSPERYDKEKGKEMSHSDIELGVRRKFLKSILKDKEKQNIYEFRKYLSESNVFFTFVHIFIELINNKEKIENPYEYIINYFQLNKSDNNDVNKKDLIKENLFYKKRNEELANKISEVHVEIMDVKKKYCCNDIANFFFKNEFEKFSACEIFSKIKKNDKNDENDENANTDISSFFFTKDTFCLFLNFLNHSTRTELHDLLMQKTSTQEYSLLWNKLLKGLEDFVKYYLSFDKFTDDAFHPT
ncbi:hypothetical protein MKS88_003765 [Plasmodium brasilianum]|uniref:Uncharacterized protein n=2 Tax=Plasmodium (Plasmodium) TaxID=418103 RepID=A0A1A8WZ15_PLAMA|nr:conserved Plasmodium protein, unknown function [Plasmodium malariae]KAI4837295.1 hypothetical protein MKS88_003765 [Plasmodium brasilianum]SBS97136.1 conserved Plasmodium protein, unknown function [Plasmodium malariae]SCO93177.1 conserved Plasmodium protein, unknown function [Plasmodium malariae]